MTLTHEPHLAKDQLIGREYLRVSHDTSGRLRSPDEQHDDNGRAAASFGITLGEPYVESTAVGASRYSKGSRDEFDRLIADLEHDRFGAHFLVLWESSRGSRKTSEWCRLLELCEERGVRILAGGRMYDPADGRDRRSLLEDGIDSEYEAWKTSMRTRRAASAAAAAGRPHGVAPYGLRPVYDPRSGRLDNWEIDPEWSPLIRELFTRLRKGHSFKGIAADWKARGIVGKRAGRPLSAQQLRDLALKPAYAGLRIHHGELIEATWEKIVDRETYWEVQRILSGPKHQVSAKRPGKALHAFTGTIKCDVCGGPIGTVYARGLEQYRCVRQGCVRLLKADVDELVTGAILGYLSRPDVFAELAAPQDSGEVEQVSAELARLRAERDQASDAEPESIHEARAIGRLVEGLTAKISALETRHRELTVPAELVNLIEPGADVAARWEEAPVSAQRKVAAILLSPRYLGQVRITRSPVRNHRVPAEQRIVWRRDDAIEYDQGS
ncbi:recombinase family protein [Allosalinactinospora lopnorensis]|uniref:recombinase family protein n=1 Tax=Allosalinactinospora lopnorensis TaxID=1352348 RepID=UPI000623EAB6|nr:recombinase family protein [Allosalinactinospora lopnorensis]